MAWHGIVFGTVHAGDSHLRVQLIDMWEAYQCSWSAINWWTSIRCGAVCCDVHRPVSGCPPRRCPEKYDITSPSSAFLPSPWSPATRVLQRSNRPQTASLSPCGNGVAGQASKRERPAAQTSPVRGLGSTTIIITALNRVVQWAHFSGDYPEIRLDRYKYNAC